jgi:pimeloyl-ACP methyl ester carboxylesterase
MEVVALEGRSGPLELLRALPLTEKSSNKPPLLFLHGAKCSAHDFMNFLPYFAAHGYPAYALSIRGHGDSYAQSWLRKILFTTLNSWARDTQSALNHIVANHPENPAPVLVGHSLGGGALQFMLAHRLLRIGDESANGQIPGLILLGSVPIYGGGPEIIGNIKEVEAPNGYPHIWSDRGLVSTPKQVRQLFFTDYAEEDTIHEWMDSCKTELESAMAGLYICFPLGDASNVLRGLAGVGTPMHTRKVLCVAGVEDKLVPPAMVLSNSGIYANAATKLKMDPETCMVVTVNNCAHHLMMDAGWEYCALAMRKWLEGQEL